MRIRRSQRGAGLSVGIDLGTTYSAVARVGELGKPEILPNRDGENITPSVVLFDGERPIVGTMAKRSVVSAPLDVVQFVKRPMGDASWRFSTAAGTSYRPEEVSALILKRLRLDATAALGTEVTDAVITVPAYFDDAARRATIDAGTIAGFNVRRVLNEPTAAALAYGLRGDHDGTVLVYDLGGGTFDVTVLRIAEGSFTVLATFGDRNLGGFDFDNELMRLLDGRFVAAGGRSLLEDDASEASLREQAEIAKHTLTAVEQARVTLAADGVSTPITVTRAEFEAATSSLLSRTRDVAELVIEEADLSWDGIDRILLAGGSTRMPMVRTMLEAVSGKRPDWSPNPDEVVAHGAAIQAQLLDDEAAKADGLRLRVQDVTSQGLGQLFYQHGSDALENHVIIPRNSRLPARGSTDWVTREAQQKTARVQITQGDETNPDYVRLISEERLPIPVYPKGAPFETTLAYDVDQIVYVELTDLRTGERAGTFEIQNIANLSGDEVNASIRKVQEIDPS
ncbi:Hsp70 family protein [Flindersiella endophytica]